MASVSPEPIHEPNSPAAVAHQVTPVGHAAQTEPHPPTIDALVTTIQREFPGAHIRITGRGRTVERQAELMAQRRIQDRHQFLRTYRAAPHITEMDQWVASHPQASEDDTVAAFVDIINRARQNGAVVSNHLSDHARDVSIPAGDRHLQNQVRDRFRHLGAHVLDEHDAVGGPHWHIDY
jgi:hypothetical protein